MKQLNKKLQPLRKKVETIEREVRALETKKENLEMMLADPELYKRGFEARSASNEYKEVQMLLDTKYAEWSTLTEEITRIEKTP